MRLPERDSDLSTPHGTLGTVPACKCSSYYDVLSTPHGTLGTVANYTLFLHSLLSFNSTRYIRNGSQSPSAWLNLLNFQLHTVH